jgi:hypothetical protein
MVELLQAVDVHLHAQLVDIQQVAQVTVYPYCLVRIIDFVNNTIFSISFKFLRLLFTYECNDQLSIALPRRLLFDWRSTRMYTMFTRIHIYKWSECVPNFHYNRPIIGTNFGTIY